MNRTKIEYLDFTWNPTVGCKGLGCAVRKNCWAYWQAKRQKHRCELCYSFVPHVHFERFEQPLTRKKPSIIGVSFMGEFYSEMISEWVRQNLYMIMEKCPQHIFVIFTKQPSNVEMPLPKNVWLGTSVNIKKDLWRLSTLKAIDATVHILSAEPLLEDLGRIDLKGIEWVIIGTQTGKHKVDFEDEWLESLFLQARQLDIPVFFKNNLVDAYKGLYWMQEFPKNISDIYG